MSQVSAAIDWPLYPIDKIIGVFTDTVTVPAPTSSSGPRTVTKSYAHSFGDSCYFQGIYTGTTGGYWDFGAMEPKNPNTTPVFQTLDLSATVDTTNLNVTATNYYDFLNSVGVARTTTYKVYLFAKNSMPTPLTPLVTPGATLFDSRLNYQKIALQGTVSLVVAAGNTGSVSVAHGLGIIPKVRAFLLLSSSPSVVRALGSTIDAVQVQITSTNVTFLSDQKNVGSTGINANIEYRIYYES